MAVCSSLSVKPVLCRILDAMAFFWGNAFCGTSEQGSVTQTNFNKDNMVLMLPDQVDFAAFAAYVMCQDFDALCDQIVGCQFFCLLTRDLRFEPC